MAASSVTPVTVLTGFLGSGKSTLINRIVRDARFADTAVLVNEWGEVPIDHVLVREGGENVVAMAGGCLCCRVAGDVVRALRELHFQRSEGRVPDYRRVVIETSALADPAPLMASLIELPMLAARHALGGVVATVDAELGMATLDAHPEAVKQAAMADRLVLTKCDRAAPERAALIEARLRALNPGAALLRSPGADLDLGRLFEAGLDPGAYPPAGAAPRPSHDPRIASFTWTREEPWPWQGVESCMEALLRLHGERILRLKGLVNVAGEPGPRAVHAVQHTLYPAARLPAWPGADRGTRLVFIGRDLEPPQVAQILDSYRAPAFLPR